MIHLLIVIIYVSFISLGLPDGLLGAAWPSMYEGLDVPVSYAGIISMIISAGTVISALFSERLVKKFNAGTLTALSVFTTAIALLGFSLSTDFWQLCLWGIPYGLGAGSVDAVLNNYVALHYKSRQMSWLHCFWGVGCTIGPYVMSYFLMRGLDWSKGYFVIFAIQAVLTMIIVLSLPLWKIKESEKNNSEQTENNKPLGLKKTITIKGVKEVMMTFLCYCALEATVGLWAVSYIVFDKGVSPGKAAKWGAVFYIGITVGRFLNGFISDKFGDVKMVRIGEGIILIGIIVLMMPVKVTGAIVGLTLIGFGCAPIYPCLIHATPKNFGSDASQAVIGVQMASAYVGTTFMPSIFGMFAERISIGIFPFVMTFIVVVMIAFFERLNKICK